MKMRWYKSNPLLVLGIILLASGWVFAHEANQSHDLEHIPPKPEGMIEFDKSKKAKPGEEYMAPAPAEEPKDMDSPEHMHHAPEKHDAMGMDSGKMDKSQLLLARGKNIYLHMCVFCHGKDGNGGGAAVDYLFPWPRDFRLGVFKIRSTPAGALPLDEDLYRTIVNGIPGTSMPAWGPALTPEDVWALVNMVKSFSPRFKQEAPGQKITLSDPPPASPELIARGKELFTSERCVNCHGVSGIGDGKLANSLIDAWKHAVFVHDITNPANFKAGSTPRNIFRTLTTGFDGTPMESFVHLPEKDRWALVHFIRSRFISELKKAEAETDVFSYPVKAKLDTNVDNPVWKDVKTTTILMRPLSSRRGSVETMDFASVHTDDKIAIRLTWKDPTLNEFVEGKGDFFRDGAAVQFALGEVTLHTHGHNEPFFGMGNRGKAVNIWHWKAGLAETFQAESVSEYSTGGVDMDSLVYGGLMHNPIAKLNPTKENAVEELNAEGFGTVTPQADQHQNVEGYGKWKNGVWSVVFLRDLEGAGKWDVTFKNRKDPILTALAVWDGSKEDRNGRKVISVWQRLNILEK